jgi:hypothetical protein
MWVHNKDLNNGNMKSMTPNLSKPTSMSFVSIAEGALYNTLYRSVENTLRYGQESSHLTSTEGHTIYTSSGLNEWLDSGHVLRFGNKLDLEELESFLDNILRNKFTETPKVVLAAGLEFRRMFDEMIKDRTSGFLTLDTTFIRKNGTDYRHLDYGSYFASYKGFAIDITIVADQSLDDVYINRRKAHDKPGTPLSSWRADILDFSSPETSGTVGSDNIAMISQDYMDYNITVNGKYRGTAGATALPITDGGVGNLGVVSGFSRLIERSASLMIKDVTRCGTIYRYQDDTDSPFTETVTGQAWFDFTN